MNEEFGLLYAAPSFLEGVARSLDIGDTLTEYNDSESGSAADLQALRSDWLAIGNDLRKAMTQFEKDHAK
jgi:hypothetical protein